MARDHLNRRICAMKAKHEDALEVIDLGDASAETRQHWISQEYPDHFFGRGPYPGLLEFSADRRVELTPLDRAL